MLEPAWLSTHTFKAFIVARPDISSLFLAHFLLINTGRGSVPV